MPASGRRAEEWCAPAREAFAPEYEAWAPFGREPVPVRVYRRERACGQCAAEEARCAGTDRRDRGADPGQCARAPDEAGRYRVAGAWG